MKKVCLILFVFFTASSFAQRSNQSYRLTTEVSQYIFTNFPFTIEKLVTKKVAIGIDAGVRLATKESGFFPNKGMYSSSDPKETFDYTSQNTFNRFYNAYTLGLAMKVYFKEHRTFYLEPYFTYRYWWFNEKEIRFDFEGQPQEFEVGYSFDGLRSEVQKDYIFGINFGRTIQLKQTRKTRWVIDFECGLGIIDREYDFTTVRGEINGERVENYNESGFGKHPRLNLGLSIGFER